MRSPNYNIHSLIHSYSFINSWHTQLNSQQMRLKMNKTSCSKTITVTNMCWLHYFRHLVNRLLYTQTILAIVSKLLIQIKWKSYCCTFRKQEVRLYLTAQSQTDACQYERKAVPRRSSSIETWELEQLLANHYHRRGANTSARVAVRSNRSKHGGAWSAWSLSRPPTVNSTTSISSEFRRICETATEQLETEKWNVAFDLSLWKPVAERHWQLSSSTRRSGCSSCQSTS